MSPNPRASSHDHGYRRQLTAVAGATVMALACPEVAETGEVSTATGNTLLDHQGSRGICDDAAELERLKAAIANTVNGQQTLRNFPLDPDEPPLLVFWKG